VQQCSREINAGKRVRAAGQADVTSPQRPPAMRPPAKPSNALACLPAAPKPRVENATFTIACATRRSAPASHAANAKHTARRLPAAVVRYSRSMPKAASGEQKRTEFRREGGRRVEAGVAA